MSDESQTLKLYTDTTHKIRVRLIIGFEGDVCVYQAVQTRHGHGTGNFSYESRVFGPGPAEYIKAAAAFNTEVRKYL